MLFNPVLWSANFILVFPIPKIESGPPEYSRISSPEIFTILVLVNSTNLLVSPVSPPLIKFKLFTFLAYVGTPKKDKLVGSTPCLFK